MLGLLLAVCLAAVAHGQGASTLNRPGGSGPTDVELTVVVLDVKRLFDVNQTMYVDYVIEADWTDPRLARAGADATGARTMTVDEIWQPSLQVVNIDRVFPQFPPHIVVDDAGRCRQLQRFVGTVSCALKLHDFPFDRQTLKLDVVSALNTADDVNLIINADRTGRADEFTIVDWKVGEATSEAMTIQLRDAGTPMAGFRLTMPAIRHANYYLFKVITPLVVIVAMSWCAFWIDPQQLGARLGIAATSLLTLIAYRFLLGNLVPKVSYLTRLDLFIFGATVLVFIALLESITSSHLAETSKGHISRRFDQVARLLAPVLLVALLWYSFG